jgi:putative SOS response-associated peptidase YedK
MLMCGRFTLTAPAETLARQFQAAEPSFDFEPRYNIAPTQEVPLVRQETNGPGREILLARWGLIPSWSKDGKGFINARADTVADKPVFRSAFRKRRCLVPANGYYEWQKVGKAKQPYYIYLRDGQPFGFAGLWETWHAPDGEVIESCSILTTDANELMRPIHDRMPVIVQPAHYDRWLDPVNQEVDALRSLMQPYPASAMAAHAVSTWVNNPRHEGPACIATVT